MTSEFSDRPLVAGTINGVRAFKVNDDGILTAVVYDTECWTHGENVAVCKNYPSAKAWNTAGFVAEWFRQNGYPSYQYWPYPPDHRLAGKDCSCGFYAYFDGSNDYGVDHFELGNRVTGIIEGYGVCTVGSRGFRAEKARIVALVLPKQTGRVCHWLRGWWPSLVLDTLVIGFQMYNHRWYNLVAAAFLIAMLIATFIFDGKRRGPVPPTRLIRENYPDVPIYPTLTAALAAHPLEVPA